jgi:GNAT superfamily N-acetyltransferase
VTVRPEAARRQLGASAALWAGESGVSWQTNGWSAFSGHRAIDYNVVFRDGGGGDALDEAVERIAQARVPTVLMVAGSGLGEVQRLVARDWVCIGATPVMVLGLEPNDVSNVDRAQARRLAGVDLAAARELISDVFDTSPHAARVALPDDLDGRDPARSAWGAYDTAGRLCSCLALIQIEDSAVVWSMATAAEARGRGYGRWALRAGLRAAVATGARRSLLYASATGEPFYRRLGYLELERWQMWSRPRWVLGRA